MRADLQCRFRGHRPCRPFERHGRTGRRIVLALVGGHVQLIFGSCPPTLYKTTTHRPGAGLLGKVWSINMSCLLPLRSKSGDISASEDV